jgi:hypothetical protein
LGKVLHNQRRERQNIEEARDEAAGFRSDGFRVEFVYLTAACEPSPSFATELA